MPSSRPGSCMIHIVGEKYNGAQNASICQPTAVSRLTPSKNSHWWSWPSNQPWQDEKTDLPDRSTHYEANIQRWNCPGLCFASWAVLTCPSLKEERRDGEISGCSAFRQPMSGQLLHRPLILFAVYQTPCYLLAAPILPFSLDTRDCVFFLFIWLVQKNNLKRVPA